MSDLPPGWVETMLGRVCSQPQYGWTTKANREGSGLRLLRTTDITRGSIDWAGVPYCTQEPEDSAKYMLKSGDIVISRAGTVGVSALIRHPSPAVFASYLIRFRPLDGVLPEYLSWFLRSASYWRQVSGAAVGIALANINAKKLCAIALPLPPADEQRRIVDAIEEQLSRLDNAERALLLQLRRLSNLRRCLVASRLHDGWPMTPLDECVEILDSKRVPVNREEREARPGKIPYYGATGQVGWIDEPLFNEELVLLGEDGAPFLDPTESKAYVIDGPAWVNNHAHVLRARVGLATNRFVKHALDVVDYRPFVNGTTRLKLTQGAMRRIEIPAPSVHEQTRLVSEIERQLSVVDAVVAAIDGALNRSTTLRRAILDRAFRGDLVQQDPDDEPASVLLERIAADRAAQPPKRRRPARTTP